MLWIGTAVVSVAGVLALILFVMAKRGDKAYDLGSVSRQWIVSHRANSS